MHKLLLSFLLPGGLIFAIAVGFLRPTGAPGWLQQPIGLLPYIVLSFGLLFSWYLDCGRMIYALLILMLVDRGLFLFPYHNADTAAAGSIVFNVTAFLLPLNLLALSLTKKEGISTVRGMLRAALILSQPFLLMWVCAPDHRDIAAWLDLQYVPSTLTAWTSVPQPALLAFGGAIILQIVRFFLYQDVLESGFAWAIGATFLAYHGTQFGWNPTNFFTAAGLILLVTFIQSSYRKTLQDELTGMPGPLAYTRAVASLRGTCAMAAVGIDQLKQYNNVHGKTVGDQVMRLVAPKIAQVTGGGKVFRLSGEEFIILFTGKSASETLASLDAIRKTVETSWLVLRRGTSVREERNKPNGTHSHEELLPVTLSIGVSHRHENTPSLDHVIKAAYRALYDAKGEGGNLVRRTVPVSASRQKPPATSGRIVADSEFSS